MSKIKIQDDWKTEEKLGLLQNAANSLHEIGFLSDEQLSDIEEAIDEEKNNK